MRDKKKPDGLNKRPASIDGIVSGGRRLGVPISHSYSPNRGDQTPTLDAFTRRSDGFHATRQSPGGLGGTAAEAAEREAILDEPIVLDELDYDKRKDKVRGRIRRARLRKTLKRITLSLLILLLAGGLYLGAKFYITQRHLFRGGGRAPALASDVDISQLKGEGDGRVNILLLGIGGPGHDGPDLTDTILLASIDPINNKIALLSIPRDLWVKIPGDGYQKINAAYPYGKQQSKAKNLIDKERAGLDLLDRTLEPVIGVPIHYHAVVDFTAFQQAVDAVGGVDVNVPEQLYDPTIAWENNYNSIIAQKGLQHMNGHKALLYAKSRETSSDFARGERQRLILVALKDKILSAGTFANPVRISSLLDSFGSNVYTDFSRSDLSRVYQITSKVRSNAIVSLDLVTPPHNLLTTGNINGLSIVEPRAGLFEYDDMKSYVRNALRDGFIAKENAQVAIYNATTTAGLATTTATTLKSYGYNVTTVQNATNATNPLATTIVDLSKGVDKYTRHYLEQRFGVAAVSKLPSSFGISPPLGTAFVIILGQDARPSN
ncbi:MAG TPA: LCP family protein [Candidatus Saccharimonadales bacterium]|nr:LCP family protein [Candidatus Saccharimonadales bacterium]